jgi:hypothetical protein
MSTEHTLNKTAVQATLHCLLGCSIGEVTGMVLTTAFGWGNAVNITVSVGLAFAFGYALSMLPILKYGLSLSKAIKVALAADTASIATMEIADNAFLLAVPGALNATLSNKLFWISLAASLVVAFLVALPVNRWLIKRGKGHSVSHEYHNNGQHQGHDHHIHTE